MFTFLIRSIMITTLVFFAGNLASELALPFVTTINQASWVEHITYSSLALLFVTVLLILQEFIIRSMYFTRK